MKKLLLVLVAVATVAFVSCKKDEGNKDADKAKTEQVADDQTPEAEPAEDVVAPVEPTGDMDADIQAMIDLTLKNIKNPSVEGNKAMDATTKAFEEYYKAQGEDVFNDYSMKLASEMLSNKEINEAMEKAL
ncbi:MAG: hypothetical protein IK092_05865, partial [Muribaculaceae bacterium]|nr:hypothetical protein [Muribaculaceae bacterium]